MAFLATLQGHLDNCPLTVVQWDKDFRVTYWSKRAEAIFGWTANEVVGKNPKSWVFVHEEDADRVDEEMGELMTRQALRNFCPNRSYTKSGEIVNCEWYNSVYFDGEGEMESILSLVLDVTERVELEQKYQRAQRLENIGLLAGGIAHDLNNVLAPVSLGAELIQRQTDDPKIQDTLRIITSAVRKGSSLVRHILNFSRGVENETTLLSPEQRLKDVEEILKLGISENIKIIRESVASDLWCIDANHTHVNQVLVNLCVNARDAMPEGGELMLAASNENFETDEPMSVGGDLKAGEYVCFSVKDTGDGIPESLRKKIFVPFFGSKPLGKGTGLGLSNSLEIVSSYGGGMRLHSNRKQGTTFEVFFPAARDSNEVSEKRMENSLLPVGDGQTILVADDKESIRSILAALLDASGYRPIMASDGVQALGLLHSHRNKIDAMVTDIAMPNIDGINLVRSMQSMGLAEIPIMAVYGSATEKEYKVQQMKALGIRQFIRKPFDSRSFLEALNDLLKEGSSTGTENRVSLKPHN